MPADTRPSDNITEDNLLIGMPFVEFAPALSGGGFGAFRNLGIINEAAIAKEIETVALRSAQSGIEVLVRELVRRFEARLNVEVFQFSKDNMQLYFAASTVTDVGASSTAVVDEAVTLGADDATHGPTWKDLANTSVVSPFTDLDPAPIVGEAVGTGQGGTFGETTGDFALDFKINVIGDVTTYYHDGVDVTGTPGKTLVAGSAPTTDQIAFVTGTGAAGGDITYATGEAPASGVVITVDYTPSFALTENTHYVVDYLDGRIRRITGEQELRGSQPVLADYSYQTLDESQIDPFTQFVFSGKARVRHLTDVGINIIWEIPAVDLRLTDDDFAFNREEFAVGNLSITLVDDGSAAPYGTLRFFDEPTANP
jgi:hypothetical protein